MSNTKGTKTGLASQDGKEKKKFMGKFAYSVLVYALYAVCSIAARYLIFEHTNWADWIFDIRLLNSKVWLWMILLILPLGIVYLDEKIERRRNLFGAITAILLPGALMQLLYLEQVNMKLAITTAIICIVIAILLALIVLPADKSARRRLKLSRRFYLLATLMKRVVCVVVAASFVGFAVFGTPNKIKVTTIYAENVEPTIIIDGETWRDKCKYYKNYICKLNPETWGELSNEEKLEVLQCVINLEAVYMGMTVAPPVSAGYIDGEGGVLAQYIPSGGVIKFDIEHLSNDTYKDCLASAMHEIRHSYQYNVIEAYESLDDKYNEMLAFREVREWIDAINDYPDTSDGVSDDEMDDYSNNAIEEDAYTYGKYNARFYMSLSMEYCIEQGKAVYSESIDLNGDSVRIICFPHKVYFSNDVVTEDYMNIYGEFDSEVGYGDLNAIIDSIETGYFDGNDLMDIRFVLDGKTITFTQSEYGYDNMTDVSGSDMWYSRYVDWEENPIDKFYTEYLPAESDTWDDDMYNFRYARAEAWKAELYNAYELLNNGVAEHISGTDIAELSAASSNTAEAFIAYAEAMVNADKFYEGYGENKPSLSMKYLGSMYRLEALRVYKLAADYYDIKDAAEVFVFDAEGFADMLSSEYGILLEEQQGG